MTPELRDTDIEKTEVDVDASSHEADPTDEAPDESPNETDETPTPDPPATGEPNVIFIATRRRNGEEERLTEAPTHLINGPTEFADLPSSDEQLKGFYYERAAELCRAFPGLYKPLVKKGE